MDNSTPTHNRRSRRSQVLLSATLEGVGSPRSVTLRNLSAEGALVEGEALPAEGTDVLFRRKDLSSAGRVVWVKGRFAGIAFGEKLEQEQVLRHIPPARPKIQPKYWRPGFSSRQMSSDQERLAESWVWGPSSDRLGE